MKLAVIVLSFNTRNLLRNCLESLVSKKNQDIKIVVVDNNSSDGSVEMVKKEFSQVTVLTNDRNLGYTVGNNVGLRKIKSKYYLLLNSDTFIVNGSLVELINFMENNEYGIVSCKIVFPDGKFQANAGDLPFGFALINWLSGIDDVLSSLGINITSFHQTKEVYYQDGREVGWVSGTALAIKDEVIKKIGFLDEQIFMYGEDVDFCIRAKNSGFKIGWTDKLKIAHIRGGSSKDPKFKQWLGEFKGIKYIYRKYLGFTGEFFVTLLIYFFSFCRLIVFLILGKINISKTYAKVLLSI